MERRICGGACGLRDMDRDRDLDREGDLDLERDRDRDRCRCADGDRDLEDRRRGSSTAEARDDGVGCTVFIKFLLLRFLLAAKVARELALE